MEVADLLTLAGLSAATTLVFSVVKRLWQPSAEALDRFGPAVAIALGLMLGGGAGLVAHGDLAQAAINGVLAGLSSMGMYNLASTTPVGRVL